MPIMPDCRNAPSARIAAQLTGVPHSP